MTTARLSTSYKRAFTLLEMTVVIMVLLVLMRAGLFANRKMDEWKLGRAASETLRNAYSAQRLYLADNPTAAVSSITTDLILPYMPGNVTVMPTAKSLTGTTLTIQVNVSPPVLSTGTATYDPSGSNKDSLWDVGE